MTTCRCSTCVPRRKKNPQYTAAEVEQEISKIQRALLLRLRVMTSAKNESNQ